MRRPPAAHARGSDHTTRRRPARTIAAASSRWEAGADTVGAGESRRLASMTPAHGHLRRPLRPRRGQARALRCRAPGPWRRRTRSRGSARRRAPFATLVAPAGYGKTTLLARWAESDPRQFAWVALDGRDDDALVFLRYITAAIHRVEPVAAARSSTRCPAAGGSTWSKHVPHVGSALAAARGARSCSCSTISTWSAIQSCLDVLAALFDYVPAGSQIAIASREAPALPLGRWRAHGRAEEISVADLRLDEHEAELLLRAAGVELDAAETSELTDRTEGWPAGLYLAALSIKAGAPSGTAGAGFTGDDRFVADYFRFELLSRLAPAEAEFLTSHLGPGSHVRAAVRRGARRRRGPPTRSTRSRARTASWCRSTGGASGIATTTCSASCCATSSSAASRRRARAEPPGDGRGASPTSMPEQAVVLRARRRRDRHRRAAWSTRSRCRSTTTAGMETARGVARLVQRGRAAALPRAGGLRRLGPRAHRAARRGRAVARARRRGDLGDPARGRQRDDRALGRDPAGAHDAGRCRAGARRRRAARWTELAPGERLAADRAPHPRRRARAARRDRSRDGRPHDEPSRRAWRPVPSEEVYLAHAQLALLAAKQGAWARQRATRTRARRRVVEEAGLGDYGGSAIAFAVTARVALHEARPRRRPRGAGARAPPAAVARPRPSLADHPVGLELDARPSRARRGERGPHDPRARPSRCSSSVPTWARWSRTRASCASAWRRAPGRPAPGR